MIRNALLITLLSIAVHSQAQQSEYYRLMDSIRQAYDKKAISDSVYLQAVYEIAQNGFGQPGFYESLLPFRELAFARKQPNLDIVRYYSLLAIDADIRGETGRCIYYKEKEVDAFMKYRPNQAVNFSMARFLTGIYLSARKYNKCAEEYFKCLPNLQRVPALISSDSISNQALESALIISESALMALSIRKDTAGMKQAYALAHDIFNAIKRSNKKKYAADLVNYQHVIYDIDFSYHKYLQPQLAMQDIHANIQLLLSDEFKAIELDPEPYLLFEAYFQAAKFLGEAGQTDSADHYLEKTRELVRNHPILDMGQYQSVAAEIAAKRGNYKWAYEQMVNAYDQKAADEGKTLTDKNNNLYAQAEAEEKKLLLSEAELKNKKTERRLAIVLITAMFAAIVGTAFFLYRRQKAKARFLEFKLNMARNIHDETSPALLYAIALAKSLRIKNNTEKNDLERHLEHTMEILRSLSHDLKSDELHSIHELRSVTENTLKKLSSAVSFQYIIHERSEKGQFISNYQFIQLKAILQECISNSIKHAQFDNINIAFTQTGNQLKIRYSDNGRGWDTNGSHAGIGSKNIEERVGFLNGELEIENNYPEGYEINITIYLR
ncbi:MAG: hypothetical protein J7578_19115 [Chitinophagaceae bacterium]|nr:hypothetical protein [Chitinophagaceae bacterium]